MIQAYTEFRIRILPVAINLRKEYPHNPPLNRKEAVKSAYSISAEIRESLRGLAEIDEPVLVEDKDCLEELQSRIQESQVHVIAVFRIGGNARKIFPSLARLGKPVIVYRSGLLAVDGAAYLRAQGLVAFAANSYGQLKRATKLLRAHQAFKRMKALVLTTPPLEPPYSSSVLASAWSPKLIEEKLGVKLIVTPIDEAIKTARRIEPSEIRQAMTWLKGKAVEISVPDDSLERSVRLYLALKRLLDKYDANAVTINCFDPVLSYEKTTPCVAVSLLNSEGIPAACEADISGLLSVAALMYISETGVFIGNLWMNENGNLMISHDVPPVKLYGFYNPLAKFSLKDFHGSNDGVSLYMEIPRGAKVTMTRIDPTLTKALIVKATVTGSYDGIACRQTLELKTGKAEIISRLRERYGHHFALALNDHADELTSLCELLGLEPEVF